MDEFSLILDPTVFFSCRQDLQVMCDRPHIGGKSDPEVRTSSISACAALFHGFVSNAPIRPCQASFLGNSGLFPDRIGILPRTATASPGPQGPSSRIRHSTFRPLTLLSPFAPLATSGRPRAEPPYRSATFDFRLSTFDFLSGLPKVRTVGACSKPDTDCSKPDTGDGSKPEFVS